MKYLILALVLIYLIYIAMLQYQIGLQEELISLQKEKIAILEEITDLQEERLREVPKEIEEVKQTAVLKGVASYYSEEGCLGCREDLLMANGERFYNTGLTVAMNDIPLNTKINVLNPITGRSTMARVTDTGGFGELGRIADLSPAVKDAIGCTDLCEVEIYIEETL